MPDEKNQQHEQKPASVPPAEPPAGQKRDEQESTGTDDLPGADGPLGAGANEDTYD